MPPLTPAFVRTPLAPVAAVVAFLRDEDESRLTVIRLAEAPDGLRCRWQIFEDTAAHRAAHGLSAG